MLVLTRRAGESIMIGSEISVRVVEVRGDVVRIGVDAPRAVQVHREEVFEAVRAQNLAAAGAGAGALDALRAGLAGRLAGAALRPVAAPDATTATPAPAAPTPTPAASAGAPPKPTPPPSRP